MNDQISVEEVTTKLAAPFPAAEIRFRSGATNGSRAQALPFITARTCQGRLDEVLGIAGWQTKIGFAPDGSVVCRLLLKINGDWLTKSDVAGSDKGNDPRAAASTAFKRACSQWGVGRYLHRVPVVWCDYDHQRKRLLKTPALPAWSLPESQEKPNPEPARHAAIAANAELVSTHTNPQATTGRANHVHETLPSTGKATYHWLCRRDKELEAKGELFKHVVQVVAAAGHGTRVYSWSKSAVTLAIEEVKRFEARYGRDDNPGPAPPKQTLTEKAG